MSNNESARLLAYVTGLVNQQLLLQNECLAAENRIPPAHLPRRLRLTNPQRYTLAEIGSGSAAKRWTTSRAWLKFDGSKCRPIQGGLLPAARLLRSSCECRERTRAGATTSCAGH